MARPTISAETISRLDEVVNQQGDVVNPEMLTTEQKVQVLLDVLDESDGGDEGAGATRRGGRGKVDFNDRRTF